jgi:membrane-bound lytic murein transglycosylase MltF
MSFARVKLICLLTALVIFLAVFTAMQTQAYPQSQQPAIANPKTDPPQSTSSLELPLTFQRQLGDLDVMLKSHQIRVLVVPSRSGFFYDKGQPQGIFYEAFDEFQRFVNQKVKTGALKVNVTFIPVRPEQLEHALLTGVGDVMGHPVIVTPDRGKHALFTSSIYSNVKQVIVTGPKSPAISSLEDLSGKEIYVNPLTVYYDNLKLLSESFQKAGKPPILIKSADPNLTDEDLLEMVSTGLLPATVTISIRADFWSKVFPQLTVHSDAVLKEDVELAWVTRKDSPKLNKLLDEFIEGRQFGTSFGNTLVRRYLQNTRWVKDSTSAEEMKKFQAYLRFFQKYAAEYSFDYLLLVAQGYQESLLDQSRKNPTGAVGIMQVIPKYAAAAPIGIENVGGPEDAENNINAGAKMLRNIADTYFNDPKLDALNKTLMVFASYNAGPTRIARIRRQAASEGLDPDKWFGNVELVVAKDIGQETVQYVDNIYKYYVAYKLVLEQSRQRLPLKEHGGAGEDLPRQVQERCQRLDHTALRSAWRR